MPNREFTCTIAVRLHGADAEIIQNAADLGRRSGRDDDWTPDSLNEAVAEIVMLSDAPADDGVEILST